jgi:predicted molibdopterin-dependent oxidoreductase YjgC
MRIEKHPILGPLEKKAIVKIEVDGRLIEAFDGEPIAAALMAAGISVFRYTRKKSQPRGIFCAIGQCTDCMMTVDGVPNVRTCITPVKAGMKIVTQKERGELRTAGQ